MEFVSTENTCGQNLLGITSRGSAIIAELLRLSSNIPDIFLGPTATGDSHRRELVEILFNYNYLHDPDEHEKIIGMNAELLDLDEELQENHSEILDRLYILFKSIWLYQADFRKYVDDVQSGFYLHHSLEDILQDMTGKQLLCEALYLYGTMLLQLEERIPGSVREKLMIANYRYGSEGSTSNIDEVCKLCRSTGYIPGDDTKRPKNYPATFFSRFAPDSDFVRLVIGCLQTDDIYHMATSFPSPDHRSTRLAQQGSILFTILYFSPDILNSHYAVMRELVDKYFNDNWVIATYMGHTVDLSVEWASYPAARTAVENTINIAFVRQLNDTNRILTKKCLDELRGYLTEGVIQQNFLLDNIKPLMKCVRSCNVALRWRLMHRRCRNQVYNKIIHESVSPHMLITLLLNTSQLEFILKEQLLQLLANKDAAWTDGKTSASGRLSELAEYFTGEKALTRVKRDEKLMNWFTGLAAQVRSLDLEEDHATSTGRRIQGLIAALEDVEQFESIDVNVQTKIFLSEIRDVLRQMIRTVNVKDELLDHIENISDFSYAWEALTDYLDVFHERIRSDSSSVVLLRATFLKAASVLDVPLIRISTIESPDAVSVAEYYSSELVEFVRLVLGIIPVTVFKIMGEIEKIQTHQMVPVPPKIEAKNLKDYAQLDLRFELSKLTHQVSIFTEGVLVMEKTLLGVIQVEPRAILEEGLRRELVRQIAKAMHETVIFQDGSHLEIASKLSQLASNLDGLKRSVEYLQDYIGIAGLKMFHEEIVRVIGFNTEQESNRFLKRKISDESSHYQSRAIPIPKFAISASVHTASSSSSSSSKAAASASLLNGSDSVNFMGRIVNSLVSLTNISNTVYAPQSSAWYKNEKFRKKKKKDMKETLLESCDVRTFALLERSLGAAGLRSLDRLFAFRVASELTNFLKFYDAEVLQHNSFLDEVLYSSASIFNYLLHCDHLNLSMYRAYNMHTTPSHHLNHTHYIRITSPTH